ncbi:MAG: hypothetical protein WCI57_00490 [Candidatus Berkelbacteria bacterium]
MNFFTLLLVVGLGFVFILYSKWITDNTMRFDWAESFLGATGTYTVWKLLGVATIIGGFYFYLNY